MSFVKRRVDCYYVKKVYQDGILSNNLARIPLVLWNICMEKSLFDLVLFASIKILEVILSLYSNGVGVMIRNFIDYQNYLFQINRKETITQIVDLVIFVSSLGVLIF